jgi:predicted transcriptional regulator
MAVGAICNRNIVIAHRDESVAAIARRMREFHVGDVVVVDSQGGIRKPLGVVTDRDLVIEVMALEVQPEELTAGDIMSQELVSLNEGEELPEATALMRSKGVRRLVIVDDQGGLAGILTVDDILDVVAEEMDNLARLVVRQGEREQRTHGTR